MLLDALVAACGRTADINNETAVPELLDLAKAFAGQPAQTVRLLDDGVQSLLLNRAALHRPVHELTLRKLRAIEKQELKTLKQQLNEHKKSLNKAGKKMWGRDHDTCQYLAELGLWKLGLVKLVAMGKVTTRFGSLNHKAPWVQKMIEEDCEGDLGDWLLKAKDGESPEQTVASKCEWATVPDVFMPHAKAKGKDSAEKKDSAAGKDSAEKKDSDSAEKKDSAKKKDSAAGTPSSPAKGQDATPDESQPTNPPTLTPKNPSAERDTSTAPSPSPSTSSTTPSNNPNNPNNPRSDFTPSLPLPCTPEKRRRTTLEAACTTLEGFNNDFASQTTSMQKRVRRVAESIIRVCEKHNDKEEAAKLLAQFSDELLT
jgi:hypothetical protein